MDNSEALEIFAEFEIEVVPANVIPRPGQTRAVATLSRIIRRYGMDHARIVVMTLAETKNNKASIDEVAQWAVSDVVRAFEKVYPDVMRDTSRFLDFFDAVPIGQLQFWLLDLDGITNKRAALVGLIWERARRVFGDPQLDLLDDRKGTA